MILWLNHAHADRGASIHAGASSWRFGWKNAMKTDWCVIVCGVRAINISLGLCVFPTNTPWHLLIICVILWWGDEDSACLVFIHCLVTMTLVSYARDLCLYIYMCVCVSHPYAESLIVTVTYFILLSSDSFASLHTSSNRPRLGSQSTQKTVRTVLLWSRRTGAATTWSVAFARWRL